MLEAGGPRFRVHGLGLSVGRQDVGLLEAGGRNFAIGLRPRLFKKLAYYPMIICYTNLCYS